MNSALSIHNEPNFCNFENQTMSQKNCFICATLLDNLSFADKNATACSLKSVLDVLGISYTSFVGDLLQDKCYELVNEEFLFCAQCGNLIQVTEDLRKRFLVSKQKLVDRVATGYQKRRWSTQQDQGSAAAQIAKRLAVMLGECFSRSTVVIRSEDEVSEEKHKSLGLPAIEEQELEEVDGSDFQERPLSPPLKKKQKLESCRQKSSNLVIPVRNQVFGKSDIGNDSGRPKRQSRNNSSDHSNNAPVFEIVDEQQRIQNLNDLNPNSGTFEARRLRARKSKRKPVEEVSLSSDSEVVEASYNDFGIYDDSSAESESSESEQEVKTKKNRPKRVRKGTKERSDTRRFPCGKCDISLVNIKSLDKHIIASHEVRPVDRFYGCAICPAIFHSAEDLKKHVVYYTIAKNQKEGCLLCEFSDDLPVLVGHYFKEHGLDFLKCKYFGCVRCLRAFKPTDDSARSGSVGPVELPAFRLFAEEHRNCSTPQELSPQPCRTCSETRLTATDLISHESTHFPDLQCIYCDFELKNEHESKVHNGIYHKQFRNLKPRVVNVRLPNQEARPHRNWKCNVCSQRFALEEALKTHMKNHAAGENLDVNVTSNFKGTVDHRCSLCSFTCNSSSSLYRHTSVLHNLMLFTQLDSSFFNCYTCWTLFEPSGPSELPGRLDPKDIGKLKEFVTEHAGCSREPMSEFACPRCSEKFTRPKHLFKHCLKCMESSNKYQCTECTSEFDNNVAYLHHMRQAHVDRLKFKCQCYKCGKYFQSSETLQNHVLESSKLLRCPCCDQNFNVLESFKKHQCKVDPVPEPEEIESAETPSHCTQLNGGFPCLSCDKVFGSVAILSVHFQEHHDKAHEISFGCGTCSTLLTRSESLQQIGDEIFYSTKNSLRHPDFTSLCSQHWKTCIEKPDGILCCELEEPSFVCYICNHIQDSPQTLAEHLNEHHGAYEVQKCPGCTMLFREKNNLHTHLRKDHKLRTWVRGRDRYFCYQCYEPFLSRNPESELGLVNEKDTSQFAAFLERHFLCKAEKVPAKCHRCPVKVSDVPNLFAHEIRFHTKNFEYFCELCGKGFPTGSHLKDHRNKVHETVKGCRKKHECHICLKRFVQLCYLKTHLTNHDNKQPPLVCQYCGKGFNFKSNLVRHEKNHR